MAEAAGQPSGQKESPQLRKKLRAGIEIRSYGFRENGAAKVPGKSPDVRQFGAKLPGNRAPLRKPHSSRGAAEASDERRRFLRSNAGFQNLLFEYKGVDYLIRVICISGE